MKHIFIFGFILSLLTGCDKRSVKIEDHTDGYKGAAKLNPYLAAQEMLGEVHYDGVKVRNGFIRYDWTTGMVISPASALSSEIMVDKMLNWVEDGGIFVCLLQRGDKHWVDVGERCDHQTERWDWNWVETEESQSTTKYLLDSMQIELEADPSGKTVGGSNYYRDPKHPVVLGDELPLVEDVKVASTGYHSSKQEFNLQVGGTKVMKYNGVFSNEDVYQEGDVHRFLGLTHGGGKIYFVTDGRLFRNPYIGMNDHAALLEFMSQDAIGHIIFAYGNRRGFWSLMGNYASPALLGLFFLLIFWLWKCIPRFGPLLEIGESHTRGYAQSISNTGMFLWKYKGSYVLLTALRDNLLRQSGMFNEAGEADERLIETFATKSGLGVEEVIEALTRKDVNDAGDMVRITKNIQIILKSL